MTPGLGVGGSGGSGGSRPGREGMSAHLVDGNWYDHRFEEMPGSVALCRGQCSYSTHANQSRGSDLYTKDFGVSKAGFLCYNLGLKLH